MSRDIQDRLAMFGADVIFKRIALNMNQITTYNLPPNPAKVTDSRFGDYQRQYGQDSWELDALGPATLDALVRSEISGYIDKEAWQRAELEEEAGQGRLDLIPANFEKVMDYLRMGTKPNSPDVILLGPATE